MVGVVAEPGVGKSRLCQEFADRCRAAGIDVYETQAQAHGTAIPFLPILQMMRGYFGIDDQDSERVAGRRSRGGCSCSTPTSQTTCPSSSTSWACRIRSAPRPR